MVVLYYISCLRYTILAGNPRNFLHPPNWSSDPLNSRYSHSPPPPLLQLPSNDDGVIMFTFKCMPILKLICVCVCVCVCVRACVCVCLLQSVKRAVSSHNYINLTLSFIIPMSTFIFFNKFDPDHLQCMRENELPRFAFH